MAKMISIELIIPDDTGDGEASLINKARDTFHNNFIGNPDYIDSNVVVHDNRNGSETFDETGLLVDFTRCKDRVIAAAALMNTFEEFIHLPEFVEMVHDEDNNDINGESLEDARNAIVDEICMEFEKGMNKYE